MKPFSKVITEYREKHSLSKAAMAELLGMSGRMYAYYEKGEFDGSPQRVKKYLDKLSGNLQVTKPDPRNGVPIYDLHATGSDLMNVDQGTEAPSSHVTAPGFEDCDFGIYVYGHSMYPTIESGSMILTKKISNKHIIMYGEVYLIRTADYLIVKRLQKAGDNKHVLCTSDNFEQRNEKFKRFEPFDLAIDDIVDLYLVKGILKKTQT